MGAQNCICGKEFTPKTDLLFYEQRCIDGFNAVIDGYNKSPTAGTTQGMKHPPEASERHRKALAQQKRWQARGA